MSIKVCNLIWRECVPLSHGEKSVLARLASYGHHDDAYIWPSIATLAASMSLTPRGIAKILKSLKDKGFITIARREKSNNYCATNVYTINVDLLTALNGKEAVHENWEMCPLKKSKKELVCL